MRTTTLAPYTCSSPRPVGTTRRVGSATMIRFACPTCQTAMSVPETQAGSKGNCPSCGQRVQVPQPELDRTVVGQLLPANIMATRPAPTPSAPVVAGWFYTQGGRRHGPIEWPELQRRATLGELLPTDLVWTEGMTNWQPARGIPN